MPCTAGFSPSVDPDFAREVLRDLYSYRRKRVWAAWALWASLGLVGAHRFYLERTWTGLAMFLTGGAGGFWWIADAWLVNRMVRAHNDEQGRREREGLPPLELSFMPPLTDEVLLRPPAWTVRWAERGRGWRALRLTGDALVLVVCATLLGPLAADAGVVEPVVAVTAMVLITMLGGRVGVLARVPGARALIRWTHRLRLFYYYNSPGTPLGLLLRALIGALYAPVRRRDRAEVRLYLELGAVFTMVFLLLNILDDLAGPVLRGGFGALSPVSVAAEWLADSLLTFLVTTALAAPIGAVLTLYILTRRTHTLARVLGAGTLAWMAVPLIL